MASTTHNTTHNPRECWCGINHELELEILLEQVARAADAVRSTREEYRGTIAAATDAGASIGAIARAAGISRQVASRQVRRWRRTTITAADILEIASRGPL